MVIFGKKLTNFQGQLIYRNKTQTQSSVTKKTKNDLVKIFCKDTFKFLPSIFEIYDWVAFHLFFVDVKDQTGIILVDCKDSYDEKNAE